MQAGSQAGSESGRQAARLPDCLVSLQSRSQVARLQSRPTTPFTRHSVPAPRSRLAAIELAGQADSLTAHADKMPEGRAGGQAGEQSGRLAARATGEADLQPEGVQVANIYIYIYILSKVI